MTSPQIGIYGLGTMGAALALNMAEKGIAIAVSNRSAKGVADFMDRAGPLAERVSASDDLSALVQALPQPRTLLAMIPSTGPMDALLDDLIPLLSPGDTVIDAGNADFHDTRRRTHRLAEHDLHFVGMGVSGGENGARNGPSMMVGGSDHSWRHLRPVVEAIAARYNGAPCVAHLGPDGAGHFVKTVHNGIEYADMQMIAEVYDLMRNGMGQEPAQIGQHFARWNDGPLGSYLFEITGTLLQAADPKTGKPMVDVITDSAGQKGTGRWTVIEAIKLGQSANMIEAAVAGRAWSAERAVRQDADATFGAARNPIDLDAARLEPALLAARVLEYAQGFRILAAASTEYDWQLDPGTIARIWRAGCIIRAKTLDDIAQAFDDGPPHGELLLSSRFSEVLDRGIPALRKVVGQAVLAGHPVPVLSAALAWFDTMRQGRGTASVIQAQRDFFGRHGFGRVDAEGVFHGPWWG
ncbi:NADP-dependent phosphogluconate dehydrogenase [Mesobacterium sp. TK19101]|uniref:6-phosphogluconate dehydrogenase, decarboxylating n=1 Tax=Mesobacterium hydrothermale TaxID=3111907 RepID=A0ABU6HHQ9_9RHOB|nr:NADP-dependent phosphogluconate dehydrogenase [Mesobacterium sp. TK19101]MEC3861993.1 NADP-dependent phosphogluconate dehydrogenase [Mesobacterium sp. TK19101]